MRRIVWIWMMLCAMCLQAQTVTNVVARQVGNTVEISYDLDMASTVSLLLSQDGGATYSATPKTITGDIGQTSAGHKKMVWSLLSDGTDWDIAKARFKVVSQKPDKLTFKLKGISFVMIPVEGGTYTMGGTSEQESDEEYDKPTHLVTLSSFYIGQTEVTQGLWQAVMETNPSMFKNGNNYPVESVSWNDCQLFIGILNSLLSDQLAGKRFALPTEAQWEYAARGGKMSNHYKYSGSNTLDIVAWYKDNSGETTHLVATKAPNELDIYDMTGNVREWCLDWYGNYSSSSQTNPKGPSTGTTYYIHRGGSCLYYGRYCNVSRRGWNESKYTGEGHGLRLVLQ